MQYVLNSMATIHCFQWWKLMYPQLKMFNYLYKVHIKEFGLMSFTDAWSQDIWHHEWHHPKVNLFMLATTHYWLRKGVCEKIVYWCLVSGHLTSWMTSPKGEFIYAGHYTLLVKKRSLWKDNFIWVNYIWGRNWCWYTNKMLYDLKHNNKSVTSGISFRLKTTWLI